jgi:folate-binding protein YgfZ
VLDTPSMRALPLHDFHQRSNGQFMDLNGLEAVAQYGDVFREHAALRDIGGVIDLSLRGRLCLTGADRQRFLNGQVTNNVNDLKTGEGCYAALVTSKAKMVSDLNIYLLENEILLDFEPGFGEAISQRLEKHLIADDVQVLDVAPHYGLLSIQGPEAKEVVRRLELGVEPPSKGMSFVSTKDGAFGELYLMNQPRLGTTGFDLFVPLTAIEPAAEALLRAVKAVGGRLCGWQALEMARIEAGVPRFGVDMDETNLPPETGLEARAISYSKGCYTGQEVIARIRTYGQVAKALRGLRLADDLRELPKKGDKLYKGDKEVGYITSALASPTLKGNLALGYVRREANQIGTELCLRTAPGESKVTIVELPFKLSPN